MARLLSGDANVKEASPMKVRDWQGGPMYWDKWVGSHIAQLYRMRSPSMEPSDGPAERPQHAFELAKLHWQLMCCRYSRGDPIVELRPYFAPMLDAWEMSERLGRKVYSAELQYTLQTWAVNFDHYVVCFWLVGLALALEISDVDWNRLIALVGNEGEDILLDSIIASRSPDRGIGTQLCFKKPYARLLDAVDAPMELRATRLREFVDHWYAEMGVIGLSGRASQALPYVHPYWYKLGDENFAAGAYFGRWCIEAVAAVKALGLDDKLCLGHEHYPGDLLRPQGRSTHKLRPSHRRDPERKHS